MRITTMPTLNISEEMVSILQSAVSEALQTATDDVESSESDQFTHDAEVRRLEYTEAEAMLNELERAN